VSVGPATPGPGHTSPRAPPSPPPLPPPTPQPADAGCPFFSPYDPDSAIGRAAPVTRVECPSFTAEGKGEGAEGAGAAPQPGRGVVRGHGDDGVSGRGERTAEAPLDGMVTGDWASRTQQGLRLYGGSASGEERGGSSQGAVTMAIRCKHGRMLRTFAGVKAWDVKKRGRKDGGETLSVEVTDEEGSVERLEGVECVEGVLLDGSKFCRHARDQQGEGKRLRLAGDVQARGSVGRRGDVAAKTQLERQLGGVESADEGSDESTTDESTDENNDAFQGPGPVTIVVRCEQSGRIVDTYKHVKMCYFSARRRDESGPTFFLEGIDETSGLRSSLRRVDIFGGVLVDGRQFLREARDEGEMAQPDAGGRGGDGKEGSPRGPMTIVVRCGESEELLHEIGDVKEWRVKRRGPEEAGATMCLEVTDESTGAVEIFRRVKVLEGDRHDGSSFSIDADGDDEGSDMIPGEDVAMRGCAIGLTARSRLQPPIQPFRSGITVVRGPFTIAVSCEIKDGFRHVHHGVDECRAYGALPTIQSPERLNVDIFDSAGRFVRRWRGNSMVRWMIDGHEDGCSISDKAREKTLGKGKGKERASTPRETASVAYPSTPASTSTARPATRGAPPLRSTETQRVRAPRPSQPHPAFPLHPRPGLPEGPFSIRVLAPSGRILAQWDRVLFAATEQLSGRWGRSYTILVGRAGVAGLSRVDGVVRLGVVLADGDDFWFWVGELEMGSRRVRVEDLFLPRLRSGRVAYWPSILPPAGRRSHDDDLMRRLGYVRPFVVQVLCAHGRVVGEWEGVVCLEGMGDAEGGAESYMVRKRKRDGRLVGEWTGLVKLRLVFANADDWTFGLERLEVTDRSHRDVLGRVRDAPAPAPSQSARRANATARGAEARFDRLGDLPAHCPVDMVGLDENGNLQVRDPRCGDRMRLRGGGEVGPNDDDLGHDADYGDQSKADTSSPDKGKGKAVDSPSQNATGQSQPTKAAYTQYHKATAVEAPVDDAASERETTQTPHRRDRGVGKAPSFSPPAPRDARHRTPHPAPHIPSHEPEPDNITRSPPSAARNRNQPFDLLAGPLGPSDPAISAAFRQYLRTGPPCAPYATSCIGDPAAPNFQQQARAAEAAYEKQAGQDGDDEEWSLQNDETSSEDDAESPSPPRAARPHLASPQGRAAATAGRNARSSTTGRRRSSDAEALDALDCIHAPTPSNDVDRRHGRSAHALTSTAPPHPPPSAAAPWRPRTPTRTGPAHAMSLSPLGRLRSWRAMLCSPAAFLRHELVRFGDPDAAFVGPEDGGGVDGGDGDA